MFGLHIHRITGVSMEPTYKAGDYVLSFSFGRWTKYEVGDVVLVDHASFGRIIKRIYKISPKGIFSMQGDSQQSTTTESLGIALTEKIIGKVIYSVSN